MNYQGLFNKKINYMPLLASFFFWIYSSVINLNTMSYKFFSLLFLIIIPGFYLSAILKNELDLNFDEFIIINVVLSTLLLLWTYILLTLLFDQVTRFLLLQTSFFLIFCEFLFYQFYETRFYYKIEIKSFIISWLAAFIPFLAGGYFVARQTPGEYWLGWDTWETATISRRLVTLDLSPYESVEQFRAYLSLWNFGFPYFVTMVSKYTGFKSQEIMRYGPIAFVGLFCVLSYLIFKRIAGTLVGVLTGTLVLMNPWTGLRFAMLLRENFSIILMLSSFLLLIVLEKKNDFKYKYTYIFVNGLFLASSLTSHMLPIAINLTVIALEIGNYYIEKRYYKIKNIAASLIVMSLFILPFYGFFIYPIKNLFFLESQNLYIYVIVIFILFLGIYILINRSMLLRMNINYNYLATIFITLSITIFILSIIKPSLFSVNPKFDYIKWHMFNRLILFTGLLGIAYKAFTETNRIVLYLMTFITAVLLASIIGCQVPLNRLIIYISLIATYFASFFIKEIFILNGSGLVLGKFRKEQWKEYGRILFIILLLAPQINAGINRIGGDNRYSSSYSSSNIEDAGQFIKTVESNEIIFPIGTSHIFEFIDAPRNMMINTLDEKKWMLESYNKTPYDLLKNVPDSRNEINKIHYCITDDWFYSEREISPTRDYLNRYCKKIIYGSLLVFSISLPYNRNDIIYAENITLEKESLMSNLIDSDGKQIINPSNLVFINKSSPHYRFYYSIKGDDDRHIGLGYAYSSNGLNWTKATDPIILGLYDDPYVINRDNDLILFCKSLKDNSIISMSSKEGDDWTNITEIITPNTSCLYWSADSPIAWIQNNGINLIYTETMVNECKSSYNIIRVNTSNGLEWGNKEKINWDIFDESYKYLNIVKILVKDIKKLKDGLYYSCRLYSEEKTLKKTWKTGSIYFNNDTPNIGIFRKFNYSNYPGENYSIESVHFGDNQNFSDLFYVWSNEANLEGLYLGIPKNTD